MKHAFFEKYIFFSRKKGVSDIDWVYGPFLFLCKITTIECRMAAKENQIPNLNSVLYNSAIEKNFRCNEGKLKLNQGLLSAREQFVL